VGDAAGQRGGVADLDHDLRRSGLFLLFLGDRLFLLAAGSQRDGRRQGDRRDLDQVIHDLFSSNAFEAVGAKNCAKLDPVSSGARMLAVLPRGRPTPCRDHVGDRLAGAGFYPRKALGQLPAQ